MKNTIQAAIAAFSLIGALTVSQVTWADSATASIEGSSVAIGSVIMGSALIVGGGVELLVVSATAVGEGVHLVLKDVSTGVETSLNIAGQGMHESLTWTGKTLKSTTIASGTMLILASQVVAFVPHAAFTSLFHAKPYGYAQ